jgi:Endonuclease/Exonuclease/phosphatase family
VVPAAGDPDVLLLGDFNSYAQEDPVTALTGGGFTDLESARLGPAAYSYLFDGQLGHLDYAFASSSLTTQVTGVGIWHINADEVPVLDYSDEIKDTGEAAFEEKPDGSALVPPRGMFQAASPYRASDHDPVLVGLFETGQDFYSVPSCRLVDTRSSTPLQSGVPRTFALHGLCGIPATARAVVLNITAITPTGSGELSVHADGTTPSFATMSFQTGFMRALLAFVSLDAAGEVEAQATVAGNGSVHLVLDVTGYFE